MGVLVGAVQRGDPLAGPLALAGAIFVLLQVLSPIHQAISANLGDRTAAWLYDRLTEACVRPPGMGHLEDPTLTSDLTVARDFDLGMTGPPLSISMDFIATGMVEMIGGVASAAILAGYAWWAPIVLAGAWLATHWLLRESAIWRDRNTEEVRGAQRDADYAYRLAVDPPASKELRLFGLAGWTIDRFIARRTRLHELQYAATRLRERPVIWSMLLVVSANVVVFWSLASAAADGRISLGGSRRLRAERHRRVDDRVRRIQLGARRSGCPRRRGAATRAGDASRRRAALRRPPRRRDAGARDSSPRCHVRVSLGYARDERGCIDSSPLGRAGARALRSHDSRRFVARHRRTERRRQDDDRQAAVPVVRSAVRRDRDRRRRHSRARSRVVALARRRPCSRTSSASSCRCATTWRRQARQTMSCAPRSSRPARRTWPRSTRCSPAATTAAPICRAANGSAIALARALAAVTLGAGVVLLDEPTAQLDVRGEAEIFDRLLAATRHCTTILISHRFSTVRHADRICVLEHGRVIELGTHDELMALGGRYRTMFDLQAQRFNRPGRRGGHDV